MRFGFIGDVHGDLCALQWALGTLSAADRVICLGDIVDGPHAGACIALLQERDVLVLQGNHDYHRAVMCGIPTAVGDWLIRLPREYVDAGFLAYHSQHMRDSAYVDWKYLYHDDDALSALRRASRRLVFCGHTHVPRVHVMREGAIERCVLKEELLASPLVPIEDDARYLVNVGRPTQCVVTLEDGHVRYHFHPDPRFEGRFGESEHGGPSGLRWRRTL